ncbi:hypothetical protein GQ55_3G246900 [Panicum hallii var. hallii]|uniref:Uncharacterized protein n=1 Tax=Panicum hallii var. hallii TaxID=1504633 RepID=A0A2T7ED08_9POAL|nr:hypothetical protein GQ55_3G246900 [Panicum hallii var. hallii]
MEPVPHSRPARRGARAPWMQQPNGGGSRMIAMPCRAEPRTYRSVRRTDLLPVHVTGSRCRKRIPRRHPPPPPPTEPPIPIHPHPPRSPPASLPSNSSPPAPSPPFYAAERSARRVKNSTATTTQQFLEAARPAARARALKGAARAGRLPTRWRWRPPVLITVQPGRS